MNIICSIVKSKKFITAFCFFLAGFCFAGQNATAQLRVPKITVNKGENRTPSKKLPTIKPRLSEARKGAGVCANPVEPLSNGLQLSMSETQVNRLLGQPSFRRGALSLFEGGLSVQYGGALKRITSITITEEEANTDYVKLHCGITVGSSKEDVVKQFGSLGRYNAAISNQYKVEFTFEENRVTKIYVTPGRNGSFK